MDIAVNAGNAMYYLPLLPLMTHREKLTPEVQRDVYEVYVQEMINLSMGQAMDIAWHRGIANADALDEEGLFADVRLQNRHPARMAAKIAAVISGADKPLVEKLGRFAESIGVAFQMQDDILDLTGVSLPRKRAASDKTSLKAKEAYGYLYT